MNRRIKHLALASAFAVMGAGSFAGCEEKGPAQKAGEGVDNAAKDLKNSVDPRGPAEKIGDKIDNATGK